MALSIAQLMVQKFHEKFNFGVGETPAIRDGEARIKLIEEECAETVEAIEAGNLPDAIDGLVDLIYVTLGTAVAFGVPLSLFFEEVHRANMEKVRVPNHGTYKGARKPEGWKPPDIQGILERLTHPPLSSVRSTDPSKE